VSVNALQRAVERRTAAYRAHDVSADEMVRALLVEFPSHNGERFCGYRIPDASCYSDLARSVECGVFNETFGNDSDVMAREYGPYEAHSTFFLVVDRAHERAVGVVRVIGHSSAGFKTLNDIAGEPLRVPPPAAIATHSIDSTRCWDIATLAVPRAYRSPSASAHISSMLYGMLYADVRRLGIEHAVAILDERAYRHLVSALGVPFVTIADSGPFDYLGSICSYATYLYFPTAVAAMLRHLDHLDARTHRLVRPLSARITHGAGAPPLIAVTR
jgi:hypothetical protein